MGDAQRLSADEQITLAREQFEDGTDLTLAVEEEFAVLDPSTLGLVGRFEELQAAARGTALEPHLVGELISSEVEVRTGRCETFEEAAAKLGERRAQLLGLADSLGIALGGDRGASLEPVAGAEHHRHAALPVERRAAPLRRVAEQHVRPPRPRRDPRSRPGGGGLQRAPHVPARTCSRSRRARRSSRTCTRTCTPPAAQIFTRMFPRCGVPDAFESWEEYERFLRFLYGTGSVTEHTQLWWSVRLAPRLPDRRDPDLRRAARAGRGPLAGRPRLRADRPDRPGGRRGRAASGPPAPTDRGEPLARDPLGAVRRAHRLGTESSGLLARRSRSSSNGCCRSPRSSASPTELAVPRANAAERQIARLEQGATLEEIYAEQVARTRDLAVEHARHV